MSFSFDFLRSGDNQKTNAKTLRKAKQDAKSDFSRFEVVFFAAFLYLFAPLR